MTELHLFFSEDKVSALTGLSKRQLRYWDRTNFFSPEFDVDDRSVYSFRDLVGLRAIAPIRKRVPLQELRKIDRALHEEFQENHPNPWASLRFFLAGRELIYKDPRSEQALSTRFPGQHVAEIDLEEVKNQTLERLRDFNRRGSDEIGKLQRKKNIARGTTTVAGTRIPTSLILEYTEAGYTKESIVSEFPVLTEEDVKAAIGYERRRKPRRQIGARVG